MQIDLSFDEAQELRQLLDSTLGDLSHEIAATDNRSFRSDLRERRVRLLAIRDSLGAMV